MRFNKEYICNLIGYKFWQLLLTLSVVFSVCSTLMWFSVLQPKENINKLLALEFSKHELYAIWQKTDFEIAQAKETQNQIFYNNLGTCFEPELLLSKNLNSELNLDNIQKNFKIETKSDFMRSELVSFNKYFDEIQNLVSIRDEYYLNISQYNLSQNPECNQTHDNFESLSEDKYLVSDWDYYIESDREIVTLEDIFDVLKFDTDYQNVKSNIEKRFIMIERQEKSMPQAQDLDLIYIYDS